MKSCI